jgi:acetolactate synthase-1/2/3 large subunit
MKGGELIAEFLIREKITHVFGLCGHGNGGMLDPLSGVRDRITLVSPRHEQTAGHMADAYFRVKHAPAATLTSCGPGSANMVMALANAFLDSSAFLAINADVPTQQFNRAPFQELYRHKEADFPAVCRPVVKRSFQPTRVEQLPFTLRLAFDTMLGGRPGPVQVDVPFNLFQEEGELEVEASTQSRTARRSGAASEDVAQALDMLAAAERPVMFIGHGVTLAEASKDHAPGRSRPRAGAGGTVQQALGARRPCRRERASAVHRHLVAAADAAHGTGLRQPGDRSRTCRGTRSTD